MCRGFYIIHRTHLYSPRVSSFRVLWGERWKKCAKVKLCDNSQGEGCSQQVHSHSTGLRNRNAKHVNLKLLVVGFYCAFVFLFPRGIVFIFIHLQVKHSPTVCVFDVDSGGWSERARSGKTEQRRETDRSGEPRKFLIRSRLKPDASDALSLKVKPTGLFFVHVFVCVCKF